MFIMQYFFEALATVIHFALSAYLFIVIARALISWINLDPYHPLVIFLHKVTEPVLAPIRRWLPLRGLGIDVSPVIVIFAIVFLQKFLVRILQELAIGLR